MWVNVPHRKQLLEWLFWVEGMGFAMGRSQKFNLEITSHIPKNDPVTEKSCVSYKERDRIWAVLSGKGRTRANAFGMWDSSYRPAFSGTSPLTGCLLWHLLEEVVICCMIICECDQAHLHFQEWHGDVTRWGGVGLLRVLRDFSWLDKMTPVLFPFFEENVFL